MSSTMLGIWLVIAISIMLVMDIIEAIVKHRNNKAEQKLMSGNGILLNDEPKIAITNPKIIPIKARVEISRSVYTNPEGKLDEYFYFDRAAKLLAKEMIDQELMDIRVYEVPETSGRYMEASVRIAKFDDDREILP